MLYFERKFKKKGFDLIIGVDEAGRGPLAGPVVAAAVALKSYRFRNRIDDSKKLSVQAREKAFQEIILNCVFGIGVVSERIIDRVNILEATRLAMRQAVTRLIVKLKPKNTSRIHVIVDGNLSLDIDFSHTGIVKGDSRSKSIACASILAKVTRDRIMTSYDKVYPQYRFIKHKGYPTQEHRDILKKIGPSSIHRRSFCCVY
ncbi:MAG: ribonuclease HII [Candidatus Omnitrophota bacterium]